MLPKQIQAIRARRELAGNPRDLAPFNPAIDSMLRGCGPVWRRVVIVFGREAERGSQWPGPNLLAADMRAQVENTQAMRPMRNAPIAPSMPPAKAPTRDAFARCVRRGLEMATTGCQWRMMPDDFPPVSTLRGCFHAWRDNGLLDEIDGNLRRPCVWPRPAQRNRRRGHR